MDELRKNIPKAMYELRKSNPKAM